MLAVMDGTMALVRSSGGSLVCRTIDADEAKLNSLQLQAGILSECNRIQRIADSM
jgi:hypothetical protein